MEELDAATFAAILSFLTPEDACNLGSACKIFQAWVEESPLWKVWCEEACPSLKLPLAKQIVTVHYGSKEDSVRFYKRLYVDLEGGPQHKTLNLNNRGEESRYSGDFASLDDELQDLVMLMDVHAGEEVLASFCSDGRSDFEPIRSANCWDVAFKGAKEKERLCAVLDKCVKQFDPASQLVQIKEEEGAKVANLRGRRDLLSFSWIFLSRSDGTVRMVFKRKVAFRFPSEETPWAAFGWYSVKEGIGSR